MIDADLIKLLAQGGIAAALIVLLMWSGRQLVTAVKDLGKEIREHTAKDLEHHAEVRETVVRMEARLDTLLEVTPVEGMRRTRTNPHGVQAGYYGPRRPGTRDDG